MSFAYVGSRKVRLLFMLLERFQSNVVRIGGLAARASELKAGRPGELHQLGELLERLARTAETSFLALPEKVELEDSSRRSGQDEPLLRLLGDDAPQRTALLMRDALLRAAHAAAEGDRQAASAAAPLVKSFSATVTEELEAEIGAIIELLDLELGLPHARALGPTARPAPLAGGKS